MAGNNSVATIKQFGDNVNNNMSDEFLRYGLLWDVEDIPLAVELRMIARGGRWTDEEGDTFGEGTEFHCRKACEMIWPHIDWHRWTELLNKEVRRPGAKVTCFMGPGSCSKTNTAGWEYLLEYYASPNDTLVLISSTDMRGLELRVWGEIKMLHEMALERYPALPGYLIDSKHCITTDQLEQDEIDERIKARDLRRGVIGIPTVQGGKSVGLAKWQGVKQKHLRLIADDVCAMSSTFLSAFSNLNNNIDFQAIICFNPDDVLDPGGIAAEPKDGWAGHMEPVKTTVWDTKFYNGRCVNLVGLDSPNFDFPKDKPARYPYLVSQKKIDETLTAFPKESFEYYSQCVGVMKISQMSRRVITRDLCRQFNAQGHAIWDGSGTTKVAALDASYGGDRCVGGYAEFGRCADGKIRLQFQPPHIIPVVVSKNENPMAEEDQISDYERNFCVSRDIPPQNFFHDSTGRGSLGTSLARKWSASCNPVEFGGSPTKRPVTLDTYIRDKKTGIRRLQTCEEAYVKFVTELWYSLRFAIEADQIRGLPEDVMNELCMRNWEDINGKKCVETKDEMKERTRKSPDLGDWAAIILEGARRLGFQISKMGNDLPDDDERFNWLDEWQRKHESVLRSKELSRP